MAQLGDSHRMHTELRSRLVAPKVAEEPGPPQHMTWGGGGGLLCKKLKSRETRLGALGFGFSVFRVLGPCTPYPPPPLFGGGGGGGFLERFPLNMDFNRGYNNPMKDC